MTFEIVSHILDFLEIILKIIFSPEGAIVAIVIAVIITLFYWIGGLIKHRFS